jgi:hypothetical protein
VRYIEEKTFEAKKKYGMITNIEEKNLRPNKNME